MTGTTSTVLIIGGLVVFAGVAYMFIQAQKKASDNGLLGDLAGAAATIWA